MKISSTNINSLNKFINEVMDNVIKAGVGYKGPIPLPTKRLTFSTRKAPNERGTETFERWELRIHKKLLYIQTDERILRTITKLIIPDDVKIELKFL